MCRGERQAWNRFVEAAAPLIRGVAWRVLARCGRGDDTADVMQEVFVRLVRNDFQLLKRYDAGRASLGTWLGVVATSTALDWLRKCQPPHEELDESHGPAQAEPPQQLPELPAGLLSPREALVLKLIYTDDLDVAEAAARLRIEAQTVRSLRHKAIRKLRDHLRRG